MSAITNVIPFQEAFSSDWVNIVLRKLREMDWVQVSEFRGFYD